MSNTMNTTNAQNNGIATMKEMKAEALNRMKALKLDKGMVIDKLKKDNTVMLSQMNQLGFPTLYWIDSKYNGKEYKWYEKIIAELKSKGMYCYHITESYTNIGLMTSFLVVSKYKEEWEMDNNDIKEGIVFSYSLLNRDDMMADLGSIGVEASVGGLKRIW